MALRQNYHERLEEIQRNVFRMGSGAADMVRMAVDAVIGGDLELASRVIAADDEIDAMERETLQRTVVTVMQENPVARDLRILVSTLGIVGEIEKVADDAVKLARRATKLQGSFPIELKVALQQLGEQARHMFTSALRLYGDYSVELATTIVEADDDVDSAYGIARSRVFELIKADPEAIRQLVRTIDAFHALEHIADHAVEIARRMQFLYDSGGALAGPDK